MRHSVTLGFPAVTAVQDSKCMIHHVARSAVSYHSPFLHIFQNAAARAFIRVQCGTSPTNLFVTGSSTNTSSRESFEPITHPRCAFPRITVFPSFFRAPSGTSSLLLLSDSRELYRCDVDSCGAIRHEPEQNLLLSSPSLVTFLRGTLEGRLTSGCPLAEKVNDISCRAMF